MYVEKVPEISDKIIRDSSGFSIIGTIYFPIMMKPQNFDQLIDNVYQAHNALQEDSRKMINRNLTIRNWLVGFYVVEYEQNGEDRAKYGDKLIDAISKSIKRKGLKGFSPIALRTCRTFYKAYPEIQNIIC